MVLNLLNLYSLIFALFDKISDMTPELESFKKNLTKTEKTSLESRSAKMNCSTICDFEPDTLKLLSLIAAVATNVSSTTYPIMQKAVKMSTFNTDNFTIQSDLTTATPFLELNLSSTYFNHFSDSDFINIENVTLSNKVPSSTKQSPLTSEYEDYNYNDYDDLNEESSNFTNTINKLTNSYINKNELTPTPPITFPEMFSTVKPNIKNTTCRRICTKDVFLKENVTSTIVTIIDETGLNYSTRRRLRNLCWETMFGQELIKLTIMDLVMTILSTLAMDFIRGVFIRYMNRCWCWDLEKKFPQYADFKVAENILHLVNNQGMVWMGMFFSPGLVVLNVIKLFIMMYFRSWVVLTCNVPHEIIFRASRSNNFYYALLLMMLFLCVLPVGYAIVRIPPSPHCGPFSKHERIFHILTQTIKQNVPKPVKDALDYIASPGIIIPLLLLLVLIIYYLLSLTSALREANTDLKIQLRRERTEERRKMFQLADRRRKGGLGSSVELSNTPFAKWKKLLSTMPSTGKSFDDTPRQGSLKEEKAENLKSKDIFSKFIKKALRKSSVSEEENHETLNQDEGTDTEQHDSLPEDLASVSVKDSRPLQSPGLPLSSGSFDYQKGILQKRNSQKSNSEASDKVNVKDIRKKDMRQDSGSSIWSDNIPVITISKTESAECLDLVPELTKVQSIKQISKESENKFKPKIKCVLRKQSTEIDEDIICYFNKDIDLKCTSFGLDGKDTAGVSESSEDTARESSTETILFIKSEKESPVDEKSTKKFENEVLSPNGSATESSADYNDINSL